SPGAIEIGVKAIRQGATIVTDTTMAMCGISASRLLPFGNVRTCLIADERTQKKAQEMGTTRAFAAVDLACELFLKESAGLIWVIGNAPTALFRLIEKFAQEPNWPKPKLVVGLPVGFVNAQESKEALMQTSLPYITNHGRKGGSNVAASVINALAQLAHEQN
ncbi:MAG: precorrin-8X methylmutase, partial [Candidatus Adiutrix sp.]